MSGEFSRPPMGTKDRATAPSTDEEGPADEPAYPNPIVVEVDRIIADLVPGYLEARRIELERIRELIRDQDFSELATIGHRLKGSGEGYGFREITVLGGDMEDAANGRDMLAVARAARRLGSYLNVVTFEVGD